MPEHGHSHTERRARSSAIIHVARTNGFRRNLLYDLRLFRFVAVLGGLYWGDPFVLGLPIGAFLGKVFAEFFGRFFRFPVLVFRVDRRSRSERRF